jgi:hypothetical protein
VNIRLICAIAPSPKTIEPYAPLAFRPSLRAPTPSSPARTSSCESSHRWSCTPPSSLPSPTGHATTSSRHGCRPQAAMDAASELRSSYHGLHPHPSSRSSNGEGSGVGNGVGADEHVRLGAGMTCLVTMSTGGCLFPSLHILSRFSVLFFGFWRGEAGLTFGRFEQTGLSSG